MFWYSEPQNRWTPKLNHHQLLWPAVSNETTHSGETPAPAFTGWADDVFFSYCGDEDFEELIAPSELHVWGLDLSEEAGECLSSKRKNSWSRFSVYEHHEEDIVPSFNMDDDTFCWTSLWVLSAGLTLTAQKAQMFPTPMIHVWKKCICILWKYCSWLNIFIGNLGLNELGSSAEKQKCHVWI